MKYTILVAEDDIDIVTLLKLYLESNGYNVLVANNGKAAYEIVEKEKVDLALLDIMMPEMDGYELTVKIREKYFFPIIFISAKNQDSDKILDLNIGADDYITKPFNPLEIVARVNSNLRRSYTLNKNVPDNETGELVVGEKARSKGGSGLGLALSKKIVEGHGGTIMLNEKPRDGISTEYIITINRI